jgi:adenosylcobinamide kinase/adenosylcobinamide-phosphate guanylyltransferase
MAIDNPCLTLILGGARSGKSSYAEALAPTFGPRVLYVATAEALDDEMRARAAAHQGRRPANWITLEVPRGVGAALRSCPDVACADVILLDCLTLLVTNVVLQGAADPGLGGIDASEPDVDTAWRWVQAELEALLAAYHALRLPLLIVSNEVGLGVVPPYSLGRTFRDCLGRANQTLAAAADQVILMAAGLPIDLKALPLATLPYSSASCRPEDR